MNQFSGLSPFVSKTNLSVSHFLLKLQCFCGFVKVDRVGGEKIVDSSFPWLTSFRLYYLDPLKCFCFDNHRSEWFKLSELEVVD